MEELIKKRDFLKDRVIRYYELYEDLVQQDRDDQAASLLQQIILYTEEGVEINKLIGGGE